MHGWMQDLRYAFRLARRRPGAMLLPALALAVAVAASTVAFSVLDAVLLRALPVEDESTLVFLEKQLPLDRTLVPSSYEDLIALRDRTKVFAAVAGVQYDGAWPSALQDGDAFVEVRRTAVSGDFFDVLGVRPALGRLSGADLAQMGESEPLVIGYGLWKRHFGGSPRTLGRRVRFSKRTYTIVGVAPRGFAFPTGAEVWEALPVTRETVREGWFSLVGRLAAGVPEQRAADEWTRFVRERQASRAAGAPADLRAVATPLSEAIVGNVRGTILGFSAGTLLLLCIACMNVAVLFLVRGAERERELIVRSALGATRGRIVRQLLTESAAFAAVAGGSAVLLSIWLVRAFVRLAPEGLPRTDEIAIDARVLTFSILASTGATCLAALAPGMRSARGGTFEALRAGLSWPVLAGRRWALVVAQIALAVGLLTAAGLLVRSFARLEQIDLGFDAHRLTVIPLPLEGQKYRSQARRLEFFDQVVASLESVSGIEAATPVLLTPFTGLMGWDATLAAEGQRPADAAANPGLHLEAVLPNYFDTTGIRILRGRAFTDADRQNGAPVVIVSERLARRLWPGADPIGKRVKPGGADSPAPWRIVVGMTANVRYRDVVDPPPAVYFPLRQTEFPARFILVRSALPPAAILSAVRVIVPRIDPEQQIVNLTRATEYLRAPLAAPRFRAASATALAAVALLLVGLGLYAVVAAFVAGSVREIAVRQALGASPADVRRLVATRALRLTSAGVVVGIAVAIVATRFIRTMLFEVHRFDPLTIAGVLVLIVLVTATAAYGPARRASRIDPAVALRAE